MFVPIRRDHLMFRESFSDASALQKNISQLTGQLQLSSPSTSQIVRSAENISSMSSQTGSLTSVHSDGAMRGKKDQLANFKKSHMSHSTGDLNLSNRLNLSLFGDVQLNDSQFFEVMYIGKIKVSHKTVPKTFIDDAIPKFLAHDKQKIKSLEDAAKQSGNSLEHQNLSNASLLQCDLKTNLMKDGEDYQSGSDSSSTCEDGKPKEIKKPFGRLKEVMRSESIEGKQRNRSASIGCVEMNRTMVFILGRTDIRLISPDRKQILLHKNFKDLVQAVQGIDNTEHFGIICSETKDGKTEFIGYVFKCQSGSIAHDILSSVSKSLETLHEQTKQEEHEKNNLSELLTCDHCPMIWYNRLCSTVDGLSDKKTYNTIMRFIGDLNDDDHEIITQKYFGSDKVNDFSLREKNKFLIALIEAHCQMRQRRHVHDTMEHRSEFLNQYLGGSTIFMKARRSLSNSFDHLLKRRGSKDLIDNNNNFTREDDHKGAPKQTRSMSLAPNSPQTMTLKRFSPERQQVNTSKMDMFIKVGNSPKDNKSKVGSWRQNILKNAVVKPEGMNVVDDSIKLLPTKTRKKRLRKKRSPEELRDLWKFAGKQIVLLLRMEKENARLQERQNEQEIRRMKLDYDDILSCDLGLTEVWERYIKESSKTPHSDNRLFLQAIKSGVPRLKRGEVWMMLADQFDKNHPPLDTTDYPNYKVPYHELLKNLTEHQHAIFMDIGRTFPNHEYYKAPFGLGQLSLFNILKAYSILDPELGYCQGLAFICGVLLLHLSEDETFNLLKHLMFQRQMRINYLPDMKHFQMQLYQLSRLIKDNIPEIYELFDKNDVATTLYASSWMLTIFSSSFELGFVAKVYDLLLFASNEVIFRVILSLLQCHKDELLKLDCFEDIMDYLKNVIPKIDEPTMANVFNSVYTLNISRQLMDYKIEYSVLKEEIYNTNQHLENLNQAREENKNLQRQLQIAESNIERLENIRHTQQQEVQSTQIQMQSLEVTIQTLGDYLTSLSILRTDVDIPTDIRRLLQQLEYQHNQQRQQQMKRRPIFTERKIGKSVSVNNNLGLGMSLKVLVEQNEIDSPVHSAEMPRQKIDRQLSESEATTKSETTTPNIETSPKVFPDLDDNMDPTKERKKKYFERTLQQVKRQQSLKSNLRESPEKIRFVEQASIEETSDAESHHIDSLTHPLSCSDINFQFNTKQLMQK